MNVEEAISRHAEWKIAFLSAINKKETLDASVIRRDDCCALGQWLQGHGKADYGGQPSFAKLIESHADFHQNAGRIADEINAGHYAKAEQLMGNMSDFSSASLAIIDAAIEFLPVDISNAGSK